MENPCTFLLIMTAGICWMVPGVALLARWHYEDFDVRAAKALQLTREVDFPGDAVLRRAFRVPH